MRRKCKPITAKPKQLTRNIAITAVIVDLVAEGVPERFGITFIWMSKINKFPGLDFFGHQ